MCWKQYGYDIQEKEKVLKAHEEVFKKNKNPLRLYPIKTESAQDEEMFFVLF